MILRNKSRYSDAEVRALVEFATEGFETRRVCVNVRNCSGAYAGRAYNGIPTVSNAPRSCRYLVVLRIGAPEKFPRSNEHSSVRWVRVKPGEAYKPHEVRSCGTATETWLERMVVRKHAYGGFKSPPFTCETWQEGLIALAAHEFAHIHQYINRLPRSEVWCERRAFEALERWRARKWNALPQLSSLPS